MKGMVKNDGGDAVRVVGHRERWGAWLEIEKKGHNLEGLVRN